MKQVYIASPLRGDYDTNIRNAVEYCRLAAESGVLALAPHIIFSQWCNDTIPGQREQGLKLGLELMSHSEELWVMGTRLSEGMQGEVEFARENGIPAYFITHPLEPSYYPVSQDGNRLLTGMDSEDESRKKSYEEQWVILRHECLKPEYRTPLNQLWLCTHGPGCRPDYKHSDTIHLLHPADGDSMAIARGQVWGVAKPETLERLAALYPALEERLAHHQEPAAEPDEDMSR